MTAQTWDGLQTTLLAALAKAQPPYNVVPVDFATLFPQATSYAENRDLPRHRVPGRAHVQLIADYIGRIRYWPRALGQGELNSDTL